ncbi:AraC family transcriptional regulator [Jiangella mangrovi]|uniref:AraC-like DNA-binding protein n=1 Tax=Jiangella mangrovi TaxID=1524084 RepID=A0A7W9LM55_9ACTN|nr:AraC family transcriptional regulator [Jiangella mangrovi]MBB5788891.1 AraC-like DNA-binding protein [Jiangella mangrovi]
MAAQRWVGWVSVRPGRLTYAGALGSAAEHAHHAVQLMVTAGAPILLADGDGVEREFRGVVVPPNVPHAILRGSTDALLVLIDPFSATGRSLPGGDGDGVRSVSSWRTVPGGDGGRWSSVEAAEEFVESVAGSGAVPEEPEHPAVLEAAALVRERIDDGQLRLGDLAAAVGLSESRLGHLFSAQAGLPFRRYVLWQRLQRALALLAGGASLTDAAHGSGFADAAHLTRTFVRMIGAPPSRLAKDVRWVEQPNRSSLGPGSARTLEA